MTRRLATALVLAGLGAGGFGTARAALPPAPFVLVAAPATTQEGRDLTLQLRARDGGARGDLQVDLYAAVIQDGKFSGAFLTPRQGWSPNAEPYRRRVSVTELDGLTMRFERVNPAGWFTFRLYFLRPGAEKLNRKHYVLQPLDVTVRIEPAEGSLRGGRQPLIWLGVLTLSSWVVVFRYPRRSPAAS